MIAIGKLFITGYLNVERVVSLAGPKVIKPRLIKTRLGANTEELVRKEIETGEVRIISGSVFSGQKTHNWASYLGRYHVQISVLQEGRERRACNYSQSV